MRWTRRCFHSALIRNSGNGARVFLGNARPSLFVLFGIFGRPPIAQVALHVEFAALVVKVVSEFVTHDGALCAVIDHIVLGGIEVRRLQDSSRKVDRVGLRIFIGVYGRRRHQPLRAIERMPDEGKLSLEFKGV